MGKVLEDAGIPHDAGVAIEFNIPQTSKRVDFIVTGTREDGQRTAVIVELKQWQEAKATPMNGIVSTFVGGREREVNHPSYQAWSYAMLIEDFNETVRQDPIHLRPCAYLHNCASGSVLHAPFYAEHVKRAPAFLRDDAKKLREFIKAHVKHGDDGQTMYRIRDGKLRPSKNLADHLASLLQGNREFYLIDEQKTVFETALRLASTSSATNKNVLIVNGGPGTGKTVVAIKVTEMDLESQFRCNGSDGYLAWIDRVLQLRETANTTLEGANYEFKVCESATELRELIERRNRVNNKARMVAGYCWDWISKKSPTAFDFQLDGGRIQAHPRRASGHRFLRGNLGSHEGFGHSQNLVAT